MTIILRYFGLGLVLLMVTGCQSTPAGHALHGGWRITKAESLLPDSTVRINPIRESLMIFTDGYYSMGWAGGPVPSPPYETPFVPTDEEKLARYNAVLVNAGHYHTDGARLVIEPLFALVPEYVGGGGTFEYRVQGDTLTLRWTSITSSGGQPDPWSAQGVQWRYTLTRLPDRGG